MKMKNKCFVCKKNLPHFNFGCEEHAKEIEKMIFCVIATGVIIETLQKASFFKKNLKIMKG